MITIIIQKISKFLALFTYKLYCGFLKVKNYFEKDAYITVTHIYRQDDKTGEYIKEIDSFKIHIFRKGREESFWGNIRWEDHEKIIELLKSSKKNVSLTTKLGLGATSTLLIPKWAKQKLLDEFERIKNERC